MDAFDAFISYFEETGRSNAETVKRNLENEGIRTFVAHIERPNYSGNFEEKVDEVIRNCKYFILLITVGIFTRPQVIREIKTAYPKGLKDNPKLIVFRQSLYNILRSHEDFSRETGIDIGKENQHDFKDDSELASRILILCKSELNRKIEGEKIPIRNAADNHALQEISYAELMRQVHRINSTNTDIQQSAWNRLEKLALKRHIGKHKETWDKLDQEILIDAPKPSMSEALKVLKIMLFMAKKELGDINYVSEKAKERYSQKLIDIMQSTDSKWSNQKSESKQIIDHITNKKESFRLYWNSWKKCAMEICKDSEFTQFTGYFINDLISANEDYKNEIEPELDEMMKNTESLIANRARQLYHELFERAI